MIFSKLSNYIKIFILFVAVIAVYKTFDNINYLWSAIASFMHILYPVFVGCAIAFLLYPACNRLESWYQKCKIKFIYNNRRAISVLTVVLFVVLIAVVAISFVVPAIIKSSKELFAQMPAIFNYIVDFVQKIGLDEFNVASVFDNISIDKIIQIFDFSNVNKYIQGVADAGNVFFNTLLSIIISIYILIDRHSLKKGTERICRLTFKQETRQLIGPYLSLTSGYMYKYFGCLLIDASVVFILSLIVFSIIGIKYSPLLALMLGLFNIIPYFGATIAAVVIIIITLVTGTLSQAIITGISIVVLQQVDANVIQPHIVKESLQIKPLWVVVAIIIGGGLFGFTGILVAVPVMAIVLRIVNDLLTARENKLAKNGINNE